MAWDLMTADVTTADVMTADVMTADVVTADVMTADVMTADGTALTLLCVLLGRLGGATGHGAHVSVNAPRCAERGRAGATST
eukprot:3752185-Prymnesium_polylepis.1